MSESVGNASRLTKSIGTWEIATAGVALVVASSTLVSEFTGYFNLGVSFVVALALGFSVNLLLAVSVADLSVAHPRAGAIYDYARAIFGGRKGEVVGVFLGLSFIGMFGFAAAGETAAGAAGFRALMGSDLPIQLFVLICVALAVVPNIVGIKATAWVSVAMLILMLGIRWFFGVAGFLGLSRTGQWSFENLQSEVGPFDWLGAHGLLATGLAVAFWSFVGIEFACSLAEEARTPARSMPRGLILGLIGILMTSWVMGLGVTGTQPLSVWRHASASALGSNGECPQLAVGQMMFGHWGYRLMALASALASISTLTIAFAVAPRILYSIARDGHLRLPWAGRLGTLHPRFGTPVAATLFALALYVPTALYSSAVIDWIYSAAYAWIVLYILFHVLALVNRVLHPEAAKAFHGRWFYASALLGILVTVVSLYYAFLGSHAHFGLRALVVFTCAFGVTILSVAPRTTVVQFYRILRPQRSEG